MHQGVGYPSSSINICCWPGVMVIRSAKLCLQRSRARYTNSPSSSMAKHLTTHACCITPCHVNQRVQTGHALACCSRSCHMSQRLQTGVRLASACCSRSCHMSQGLQTGVGHAFACCTTSYHVSQLLQLEGMRLALECCSTWSTGTWSSMCQCVQIDMNS